MLRWWGYVIQCPPKVGLTSDVGGACWSSEVLAGSGADDGPATYTITRERQLKFIDNEYVCLHFGNNKEILIDSWMR